MLDPIIEQRGVGGAIKQHRRGEIATHECADQAGARASIARAQAIDTLPRRCATMVALGSEIEAGFIEIHQRIALVCEHQLGPALEVAPPLMQVF